MTNENRITVKVDAYTRWCLTAIAVLLTVLIVGLWCQNTPPPASAQAEGFGGTGTRIADLLDAQQQANAKLDAIVKALTVGPVKVQMSADGSVQPAGEPNGPQKK